jgi:hypothetical protein
MRRSWYELYTLLVCAGSLLGLVAALFWLLYGVLSWVDPELTLSPWDYASHQTNEEFLQRRHWRDGRQQEEPVKLSDEEITRRRLTSYEALLAGVRRSGKLFTILNGFGIVIASVLFTIHWRLARQAREMGRASELSQSG